MVAKPSPSGLIATTRADATPPLGELADCCGWPLLFDQIGEVRELRRADDRRDQEKRAKNARK